IQQDGMLPKHKALQVEKKYPWGHQRKTRTISVESTVCTIGIATNNLIEKNTKSIDLVFFGAP
ncbi:MAG: hypothetical protein IJE92_01655, partial [Clostridia bacterium]|nr:hypothetical protein [Clostridia bacterium]